MRRNERRAYRRSAWILAVALLPSVAFIASWQQSTFAAAQSSAMSEQMHSFAGPDDDPGSGEVRQCTPDAATCDDLPTASASAVVSLAGDVVAAVAGGYWTLIEPPAALVSHDVVDPPDLLPPRSL